MEFKKQTFHIQVPFFSENDIQLSIFSQKGKNTQKIIESVFKNVFCHLKTEKETSSERFDIVFNVILIELKIYDRFNRRMGLFDKTT